MRAEDKKRETGNAVWSVASSLLSRGATVIFTPIFTRILTPSELGVYSLYTSLMGIFTVLCTLEISGSAIYKGFATFDGDLANDFTSAAVGAEAFLTAVSLALYFLFKGKIDSASGLGGSLVAILILQIFANAVIGIYIAKLRYRGNFKAVALVNAVQGLLSPPFALLLIYLGIKRTGRIYAQLIISVALAVILIIKILRRSGRVFSKGIWKYIFRLLIPMLPHYIALSSLAQADKIIVAKMLGEGAVGSYSVAFSIGHLPSVFTSAVALAMTPSMIKKIKSGNQSSVDETSYNAIKFGAILILAFLALLPEVFTIFTGRGYYSAIPVAYVTAVGLLFSFTATLINSALLYYAKTVVLTKNTLVAAALTLPLSYLLTEGVGYIGAAVASCAGSALLMFLGYKSLLKYAPRGHVKVTKYIPVFLLFIIFSELIFILRPSHISRLLLFLAISLILCLELRHALYKRKIKA